MALRLVEEASVVAEVTFQEVVEAVAVRGAVEVKGAEETHFAAVGETSGVAQTIALLSI